MKLFGFRGQPVRRSDEGKADFPRDLYSLAFERDPQAAYHAWSRDGGVLHFPANNAWVVLDYDNAAAVLRDSVRFSSRAFETLTSPLLHAADPPAHTELRRELTPFFTPGRQAALLDSVESTANDAVARISGRKNLNVFADVAQPVPLAVACQWLGVDRTVAELCLAQAVGAVGWQIVKPALSSDGLMSELIRTGMFSEVQLAELTAFFLTAAVTTSRDFIWLTLRGLALRPEALSALKKNPAEIEPTIEEMLRLEPPVHALLRTARTTVKVGGCSIPEGSLVWISLASANRDPSKFDRPDDVVLRRGGPRHMSFGNGPHFCLGSHLGKMIGKAALTSLLPLLEIPNLQQNIPSLEFERDHGLPITWRITEWTVPITQA